MGPRTWFLGALSMLVLLGMLISFSPAPLQAIPEDLDPTDPCVLMCQADCTAKANEVFGECMGANMGDLEGSIVLEFCKAEAQKDFQECFNLCVVMRCTNV